MNSLFEEHQYQHRLLPWLLILSLWAIVTVYLYDHCLSERIRGAEILLFILIPLSMTLLMTFFHFSVKVDHDFLMFRMIPFHLRYRKIKLTEIRDVAIRTYNSDKGFHGWGLGLSLSRKYKSYTVKGYNGVEITLISGKKLFIGTQRPEALIEKLQMQ